MSSRSAAAGLAPAFGWPESEQQPAPRRWPAAPFAIVSALVGAVMVSGLGVLLGHEVERGAGRNQFLLLRTVLELPDDALRMLHHPPAHIALVDGLTLLRVLLQMRDAGEAERQFRIVEMLLPLEVDLEVLPLHRMQFVLEPDDAGLAVRGRLLAEEER